VDFIFELIFQVVFEVIGECLFQAGFHGAAWVLRSRVGRFVVASLAGFGAGFWWGARLSTEGRVQEPRTLWISLFLAVLAGLGAVWRWRHTSPADEESVVSPPWRWPTVRLVGFALLNSAIAAGVAIGFQPHPLR
jgi:hypothetical protein